MSHVMSSAFQLRFAFLCFQVNSVWSSDEALCGGQHIPQVPHHHQVLPENVEQCQRDANFHISGRGHSGRPESLLELDLRHRHCPPVSGGTGHRSDPLAYFSQLNVNVSCRRVNLFNWLKCMKREQGALTEVNVNIMCHHRAVGVWEGKCRWGFPCWLLVAKPFRWWFVMLDLLVLFGESDWKWKNDELCSVVPSRIVAHAAGNWGDKSAVCDWVVTISNRRISLPSRVNRSCDGKQFEYFFFCQSQ